MGICSFSLYLQVVVKQQRESWSFMAAEKPSDTVTAETEQNTSGVFEKDHERVQKLLNFVHENYRKRHTTGRDFQGGKCQHHRMSQMF